MPRAAERGITALTLKGIGFAPPPHDLGYRQRFSERYDWAGAIRTVEIAKGGTRFRPYHRVVPESRKSFDGLIEQDWLAPLLYGTFCEGLAEYYYELNLIHPFREGNGRVQRLFFRRLALAAGYALDGDDIESGEWTQANIDGMTVDHVPMANLFKRIVMRCR